MAYFITDTCIGCSICETKCPTDTIVGEKKDLFEILPENCIDCGTCAIWCPVDCIEDSFGVLVKGLKAKEIPKAKVDLDGCVACEYCVDACPFDCITMENHPDGQFPQLAVVDEKKCTGCRLCEESCLWEAIYMDGARLTNLSQSPLKTTYFDKIMPREAQLDKSRDEAALLKKKYLESQSEEKKEEETVA